jgi:DNA invertase Pin-like site-specific DNA recombinase
MPSETPQKAILYAAKSTEDIRGSIPGQLQDGRDYAKAAGLGVVAEYSEEDVSAYKGNRGPELAAALEHVERIRGMLIVQHSDRLARGDGTQARHLVEIALWARRSGVSIHCIQDPSTFESLVLAAVMGERNMEDSRRKSAAVAAGIARRRATGRAVGGRSYGYTRRRDANDERVLVPDPDQALVVERIYDEYLGGAALFAIARRLNVDGVPTLRGGMWKPAVIGTIIDNPIHGGMIRDGDKLVKARHEAIISRARWEEAQAMRATTRGSRPRGRPSVGLHLFRKGFLRCGECGQSMIVRSERNRGGSLYETYRCSGHLFDPASCPMVPQRRESIDTAVYAYFEQLGADAAATRDRLVEAVHRQASALRVLHGDADREAQDAEERLRRIKVDYVEERLTAIEWRGLREDLQPTATKLAARRQSLGDQLADLEAALDVSEAESELRAQLERVCTAIAAGVEEASDVAAIRAALMAMFDHFILHLGVPAEFGLGTAEGWIEGVIKELRPWWHAERPHSFVVQKVLSQLDHGGRQPWGWALLQGPIAVPEMRAAKLPSGN